MNHSNYDQTPAVAEEPTNHQPPASHDAAGHEQSHVPVRYSSKTGRAVVFFAVVVVAALAVAVFFGVHSRSHAQANLQHDAEDAADAPAPVNVMHVQHAPPESLISLPGEARSFYETVIFARTSGYLSKWLVDMGDRVKEGQVLAIIDNPELDDQLTGAKAKVKQLEAEVEVAKSNANFAKVSFDRWFRAAPEGVVSEQERDQKKAELENSTAKLEAAKAQVNLGKADVQRLETLEKFKTVVAPYDGVITQRHVDVGALVTAGSTTNTSSLFTISKSDQMRVLVDVPQPLVANVKIGMPVSAQVAEYPDQVFEGKVDRTAEAIDQTSKMLRVEVLVPNAEHLLLPGMYANVTFKANRSNPPLRIPAAALCLRPTGPHVATVSSDGRVMFRPIKIGRDLGDYIEISSGLDGSETVALNIGNDVTDGSRIEARTIENVTPTAPRPAAVSSAKVLPTIAAH